MNAWTRGARKRIAPDTALLCATIVIAPQLFGGAFPWTGVTIAALCVGAFAAALWVRRLSPTHAVDGVFLVMLFAWGWTCVQAVPLSPSVAELLGLETFETVRRLRDLAWAGEVPFTISHDPGSTHAQVLIGVSILSAFMAARLGGPDALQPIAIATAGSATLVAAKPIVKVPVTRIER